ncbi:MAG: endolytic transglycosylase MltG [Elusimicrobiota bacterium]|nr:endolytic transglycosylase MltG [Elusimicrobiota bacterium]
MKKKYIFAVILLLLAAVPYGAWRHFNNKGPRTQVEIPAGTPAVKIADILKENGIIQSRLFFKICLKLSGSAPMLRSGTFLLNKNTSSIEAIWRLINDSGAMLYRVIIPEGWRIEEIAGELQKNGITADNQSFIDAAKTQELEGYLFPSTYMLPKNMRPESLLSLMVSEYKNKVQPLILRANTNMSERQVLTIASIVEREAVMHDERPKIAAVYLNRIKIGKRLEADPTVQYALGWNAQEQRHWKKGLTLKDLRLDSPYNTYRYGGIPPGPIANPGISSVEAVLHPEPGFDALYFVADNTGRHVFSKTYNEHIQNIKNIRGR